MQQAPQKRAENLPTPASNLYSRRCRYQTRVARGASLWGMRPWIKTRGERWTLQKYRP
jgi:hypothetical protein